jgi:hypothetical protein
MKPNPEATQALHVEKCPFADEHRNRWQEQPDAEK